MSNTLDNFVITNYEVLFTDLFKQFRVFLISEQIFGILVRSSIGKKVLENVIVAEFSSDVVNSLSDIPSNFSHLVKRR